MTPLLNYKNFDLFKVITTKCFYFYLTTVDYHICKKLGYVEDEALQINYRAFHCFNHSLAPIKTGDMKSLRPTLGP